MGVFRWLKAKYRDIIDFLIKSKSLNFYIFNLILPLIIPVLFLIYFEIVNVDNFELLRSINQMVTVFLFVNFFLNIASLTDTRDIYKDNPGMIDNKKRSNMISLSILFGIISIIMNLFSYNNFETRGYVVILALNCIFIFILLTIMKENPFVQGTNENSDTNVSLQRKNSDKNIEYNILRGGDDE